MNLLIDIGNSRIKWTLTDDENVDGDVIQYESSGDPDSVIRQLVDDVDNQVKAQSLTLAGVWVASVGDSAFAQLVEASARDHWAVTFDVAEVSDAAHGIRNSYQDPAQMGVDRWVALIAARQHVGDRAVVVVDAGTAITIDTLDAEGVFLGGLILPGAALARRSLLANTDRINESGDGTGTGLSPFGVNTGECVKQGSRFAAVGGVQLALTKVTNALGEMPEVILCGGGADTIDGHLDREVIRKPWLVLEGLALLAQRS